MLGGWNNDNEIMKRWDGRSLLISLVERVFEGGEYLLLQVLFV